MRAVPNLEIWEAHQPIVRIHHRRFGATEFNPGLGSGARFSPLFESGTVVPTLYASNTFDGAISETIFHRLPLRGDRRLRRSALTPLCSSTIAPHRTLILVQLRGFGLDKLRITRAQLIDTDADQYPATRAWAAALYADVPTCDGFIWTSRRHDTSASIILFGTRITRGQLDVVHPPRPLDPPDDILLAAAAAADVTITS